MKKHSSEEAFYQRLRNLSDIPNTAMNEQKTRTLGTLIDFKRGADNVAYGIVKENHHYYLKKSNSQKDDLNESDFAYIGGLSNITEHQYKKLSEADKNRNMILLTINEALGGKTAAKEVINEAKETEDEKEEKKDAEKEDKEKVEDAEEDAKEKEEEKEEKEEDEKEDKKEEVDESVQEGAEEELAASAAAASELDAAVEKEKEEPAPEVDVAVDTEVPAEPEVPAEEPAGEEDIDVDAVLDAPADEEGGEEELPAEEPAGDEIPADDEVPAEEPVGDEGGDADAENKIKSYIGKAAQKINATELSAEKLEGLLDEFFGQIKEKLSSLFDIDQRKDMANEFIIDIEMGDEDAAKSLEAEVGPEEEIQERKSCDECGFAKYVSERGYDADSIMECGVDEMANLMSGYIMDKDSDMGDEDYEDMAVFADDEIMESLVNEYGHSDLKECMQPFTEKLNEEEANPEAKKEKVKGMFWWEIEPQKEKSVELVAEEVVDETVDGKDPAATDVQPNLKEEDEEEEATAGEEMEADEVEDESGEEDVLDLTKREEPEPEMTPGFETMAAGVVKPDSAEMETEEVKGEKEIEIKDSTVHITMNESEAKLRKYIRQRLEEKAGMRKPSLNEDKKSDKLKQLDGMIDEQLNLFESFANEADIGKAISGAMGKAAQWMQGDLKLQNLLKKHLPTIDPANKMDVDTLFYKVFKSKMDGATSRFAQRAAPELKMDIMNQAVEDQGGLGKVVIQGQDIAYEPVQHAAAAGPSGFAMGRSRLGT